jgi:hypothetical protein
MVDVIDFVVEKPIMPHKYMPKVLEMAWQDILLLLTMGESIYPTAISMKIVLWTTLLAGSSGFDRNDLRTVEKELSRLMLKRLKLLNLYGFLLPESVRPDPMQL